MRQGVSTDGYPQLRPPCSSHSRPPQINPSIYTQVLRRVTGRADRDVIPVESGYGTPPALEGQSCLYVLRYSSFLDDADRGAGGGHPSAEALLPPTRRGDDYVTAAAAAATRGDGEEAAVWFYVGESDAIRERLKQHARRWGGSDSVGGKVFKLDAAVVAVENRSEARRLETAVIRAMKEEGFHLVSDKDGSRTHFSSWK